MAGQEGQGKASEGGGGGGGDDDAALMDFAPGRVLAAEDLATVKVCVFLSCDFLYFFEVLTGLRFLIFLVCVCAFFLVSSGRTVKNKA